MPDEKSKKREQVHVDPKVKKAMKASMNKGFHDYFYASQLLIMGMKAKGKKVPKDLEKKYIDEAA